ncbi:hypothetical protein ACOSQ3_019189 [Xanthoceras sorbifolium]
MVEQQFLFSEEGKSSTALEDVLEVKGGISHGQQRISFQFQVANSDQQIKVGYSVNLWSRLMLPYSMGDVC